MNEQSQTIDFSELPSARIIRRAMALVYDSLLMASILIGLAIVVTIIQVMIFGAPGEGEALQSVPFPLNVILIWWVLALYYVWCWKKRGQTLAMKTWRLRLQQPDGSLPTKRQRWVRVAIAPFCWLSVVGILWQLVDRNGDCLQDRLSGTRTVFLPKKIN